MTLFSLRAQLTANRAGGACHVRFRAGKAMNGNLPFFCAGGRYIFRAVSVCAIIWSAK